MGAPTNDVSTHEAAYQIPAQVNDSQLQHAQQAIVPVQGYTSVQPPSYERADTRPVNNDTPGVPRSDDPARAELAYGTTPQTTIVTPLQNLQTTPANVDCPFCHQITYTDVRKKESDTTWLYTILCCLCCGLIGVLFPLLLHWANDFEHFCKNCGNRVALVPHEGGSGTTQTFGPVPVVVAPVKK